MKMNRDEEFDDPFDLDSNSMSRLGKSELINQNEEFPFKIGSNFFEHDSETITNESQNMSFDDILDQRIAKEKKNINDAKQKYGPEQIMKINKINENIKSIVVLENEIKTKLKSKLSKFTTEKRNHDDRLNLRKNFSEIVRKIFRNFENTLSTQKLETIKFDRISKIAPEKRSYYLNKTDQKEMEKRKFIKIFISEKDIELLKKRGQLKSEKNENDMKEMVKNFERFITESASEIEVKSMNGTVNKIIRSELEESAKQLKSTSAKNKETLINLNQEIGKKIESMLQTQDIVNKKRLKVQMEQQNRIINNSENLLEIIPPKRLFSLMPTFNRESFLKI